jgi:hypothetical protein
MGVELGKTVLLVGRQQRLLGLAARLALVERDQHGDAGIHRLGHDDAVQLLVVVAEHVEVERHLHPRQDVLQDRMHVVAADEEQVELGAGRGRVDAFLGVLGEVRQLEGLQGRRRGRADRRDDGWLRTGLIVGHGAPRWRRRENSRRGSTRGWLPPQLSLTSSLSRARL